MSGDSTINALLGVMGRGGAAPTPTGLTLAPKVTHASLGLTPATKITTPAEGLILRKQAAAQAAAAHPHRRSLLEQITDPFTSIPQGLAHIGGLALRSATAPIRAAKDLITGDGSVKDAALTLVGATDPTVFAVPSAILTSKQGRENYLPLQMAQAASMKSSGLDIIHPTRFARASDQGNIVDKILEDAGNASIVAGGLGKVLGAAGESAALAGNAERAAALGRVANVTERVAKLGGEVANAPLTAASRVVPSIWRTGLRVADEGIMSKLAKAAEGDGRLAEFAKNVREAHPSLTPEGRQALGIRRASVRLGERAYAAEVKALGSSMRGPAGEASLAEQGAATALRTGIADVYKNLVDQGASPTEAQAIIARRSIPEQTFTPDVAKVVHDYVTGSIDPQAKTRVDTLLSEYEKRQSALTAEALAGKGRVNGPMDPRYTGSTALPENVNALLPPNQPLRVLSAHGPLTYEDWRALSADERASLGVPTDEAGFIRDATAAHPDQAAVAAALDNPAAYPAAWRNKMVAAQRAREVGYNTPLRPEDMIAAGMDQAGYLHGGPSALVQPTKAANQLVVWREGMPGIKGVSSEKMRVASEELPYSTRTVAEGMATEARRTTMNQAVADMMRSASFRTVSDMLDPAVESHLADIAHSEAVRMGGTPTEIALKERQLYGRYVSDELAKKGYEPFVGDRANPQVGDFEPLGYQNRYDAITGDTVVLPTGTQAKLKTVFVPANMNQVANGLAKINAKFKTGVLPLSIRWMIGDAVGGFIMAFAGGGMAPDELLAGMRKAAEMRKSMPEVVDNILHHPRAQDAGLAFGDASYMTQDPLKAPREPRTPIGKTIQASFKVNGWLNKTNRQGYLIARVERELAAAGEGSIASVDAAARWKEPRVQTAIEAAVDDANKVMGTFDDLTPFERHVLRNVFPFYAWYRHITQLAWHMAIDNPVRMMWTLRLGSIGAQDLGQHPEFLNGSIKLGSSYMPLAGLNPFNDVASSVFDPRSAALQMASPALKFPFEVATGLDTSNQLQPLSTPYDAGGLRSNGKEGFRTLIDKPGEALYRALRILPQTRIGLDLLPTGVVPGLGLNMGPHPRYGTGEFMVRNNGQPIDTTPRVPLALSAFGIPRTTSQAKVDQQNAIAAQRRAKARARARKTKTFQG